MAFSSWAPLWSGIVDSSLWDETDSTIKVFITMLAMKDADHVCRATVYSLSKKTGKTQSEVMAAIKVLSEPDVLREDHQEFEGRRIEAVEEGWLILNGEKYRQMVSEEMRRARNRRSQAAWRERQKRLEQSPGPSRPVSGEPAYLRAERNGATPEQLDQLVTDHLPPQREQDLPVSEQPTSNHPEIPEVE